MIYTVKDFGIVNKAEVDFLELAFSMIQWMLAIWPLIPHSLSKPSLEDFEHHFTSVWDECNCAVVWPFFGIFLFFGSGMKTDFFQSCGHSWVFQICWHIECSTFIASSFRIWNISTGIPSPSLALLVVLFPKAQLTSHSRMSGSRWVICFLTQI